MLEFENTRRLLDKQNVPFVQILLVLVLVDTQITQIKCVGYTDAVREI